MSETIRRRPSTAAVVLDQWEQSVVDQLRRLRSLHAYGSLRIQLENGRIVRVLIERSIKSPEEPTD